MDDQMNLGPSGYGPPGGGGYGPPPGGGGGYGPPPGGGGYGAPPPGGFGGGGPGGYGGGGYGGGPFGPPGPQMPNPIDYGPQPTSNGLAIGSLICGIAAIPTTCCCSIASLPVGIAACIMGGMALSKVSANPGVYGGKGMAIGGLVCGALAIVFAIVMLALGMGRALIDQYAQ